MDSIVSCDCFAHAHAYSETIARRLTDENSLETCTYFAVKQICYFRVTVSRRRRIAWFVQDAPSQDAHHV